MKKLLSIILMMLAFSAVASAQQIEKLFDKYMEDERFNYIYQMKQGKLERYEDFGKAYDEHLKMESDGKRMLTLNSKDEALAGQFTREVDNALKADKYENTSLVRNGKNRVEEYYRKSNKGVDKISFIKNPGNIIIVWNAYVPAKTR